MSQCHCVTTGAAYIYKLAENAMSAFIASTDKHTISVLLTQNVFVTIFCQTHYASLPTVRDGKTHDPLQCHVIVFSLVKYNVNRARVVLNKAVFSVFSKPTNCREDQSNPVSRLASPVSVSWRIPSSETRVSDRRAAHYIAIKLNDSDGEISGQPRIFK
jgi:hypothetical protein